MEKGRWEPHRGKRGDQEDRQCVPGSVREVPAREHSSAAPQPPPRARSQRPGVALLRGKHTAACRVRRRPGLIGLPQPGRLCALVSLQGSRACPPGHGTGGSGARVGTCPARPPPQWMAGGGGGRRQVLAERSGSPSGAAVRSGGRIDAQRPAAAVTWSVAGLPGLPEARGARSTWGCSGRTCPLSSRDFCAGSGSSALP